ncbi:bifunctional 3-(3-hydroxy-phenyl)propionate/3-hydroxycinnamic acid hydroxylase [Epidermidibacterium keratini]|uniref:Bifunctional 3-(3-hydroxy-phenyl)propionate/3-hydroxycinnamic acid hydroxylase n=1 Tax=Epidermidibacterium keratini TaxID=1891644 RepID=A0A7L4YT90_9ACTN|nr:bifunctional 3-(3-hydroxy-phenyl)propionate/3-hydroxycinnamic acid hydroxylase [Epidermidibacterium keratini]QHC01989.1 bifunctional 3-(3-hydroxy-phenyl)propionate/3-hydroxycinnamic acid hydroxylase [Epidermidibacterium keratini]
MSAPQDAAYDVVIVGMGPVGRMAALAMGRRGHRVLVVDRKMADYPLPRAVAHDDEIARILQNIGLPVDQSPETTFAYFGTYLWVNAAGEHLEEIDWSLEGSCGWSNVHFYHQPALEKRFDAAIADLDSVTVQRGVLARVVGQDEYGVDLTLVNEASGEQAAVRAAYVIGADGARSTVRADLGIAWHDLGFEFDWLVVDVVPGPDTNITDLALQVCDPVRPTTVVPGGPGRRRWEFMLLDDEDPADIARPEKVAELLAPFGVTYENSQIDRAVVYRFTAGWATAWRSGRVLLAGDAAHLMPPFAGQGLANGFRDIANLSWKLDLVLRGLASDGILETYESERVANVAGWIDFSMALGRIICVTDPQAAAARDREMTAALAARTAPQPPPTPSLGPGLHAAAPGGVISPQGFIGVPGGEGEVRFDDVFGAGALIVRGELAAADRQRYADCLAPYGVRVVVFDAADADFIDSRGTYAEWCDSLGASAVLVRPDLAVYGAAATAGEISALVDLFIARVRSGVREPSPTS